MTTLGVTTDWKSFTSKAFKSIVDFSTSSETPLLTTISKLFKKPFWKQQLILTLAGLKTVELFGEEGEEHIGKHALEITKELKIHTGRLG